MICYIFKAVVDGVCYALGNVSGIYNCAVNILAYITSIFSVLILGFAIAYVPVSYTHLDVYKRQPHI